MEDFGEGGGEGGKEGRGGGGGAYHSVSSRKRAHPE